MIRKRGRRERRGEKRTVFNTRRNENTA